MRKEVAYTLIFSVGAALGAVASWQVTKTKYEKIANEEIDSIREYYKKELHDIYESESNFMNAMDDLTKESYDEEMTQTVETILSNENYTTKVKKPYVIKPDDYGDIYAYDKISLTLYSDGVLTDDMDNPIEDIDEVVGYESLTHFGEYEDDSVFVRNDEMMADYEILLDNRAYSSVQRRILEQED